MKLMVLMLIVTVASGARVQTSSITNEEDTSVKRDLEEGTFGLKIKPSSIPSATTTQPSNDINSNDPEKQPKREFDLPTEPIAKISDFLTGHGPAFPDAIQKHLYSPVQIYQPRLGSPTTLETSAPATSQLTDFRQRISAENVNEENFQKLRQNSQSHTLRQSESPSYFSGTGPKPQTTSSNKFTTGRGKDSHSFLQPTLLWHHQASLDPFHRIAVPITTSKTFTDEFLSFPAQRIDPLLDLSHWIYHQLFSAQTNDDLIDIYQQINHLQPSGEQETHYFEDYGFEEDKNTLNTEKQISNVFTQPQAVSYARFSQGLPTSFFEDKFRQDTLKPLKEQLPQSPTLSQPSPVQLTLFPTNPYPTPSPSVITTTKPSRPIGVIRIRQSTTQSQSIGNPETKLTSTTSYLTKTTNAPVTSKAPIISIFPTQNTPSPSPVIPSTSNTSPIRITSHPIYKQYHNVQNTPSLPTLSNEATLATQSLPSSAPTQSPSSVYSTTVQPTTLHTSGMKLRSPQFEIESPLEQKGKNFGDKLINVKQQPDHVAQQIVEPFNKPQSLSSSITSDSPQQLQPPPHHPQIQIISQPHEFVQTPQSQKQFSIIEPIPQQIDLVEHTQALVHPQLIQQLPPLQLLNLQHSEPLELQLNQTYLQPEKNQTKSQNGSALNEDESGKRPSEEYLHSAHNTLFSEEERFYIQPPYVPVVNIGSVGSVFHEPLSGLYVPPPYHHTPTALSAPQYFGNYAPDIFRNWRY